MALMIFSVSNNIVEMALQKVTLYKYWYYYIEWGPCRGTLITA